MLAHDILGTRDSGGSNIYLMKYDDTSQSKLAMACLWDFDSTQKTEENWSTVHSDFFYYADLFGNRNPDFVNAYIDLWNRRGDAIFASLLQFIADFGASATAEALQRSRPYDHERWNYPGSSVAENLADCQQWFTSRQLWLRQAITRLEADTKVEGRAATSANTPLYRLDGTKTDGARRGIYVKRGKVYIR